VRYEDLARDPGSTLRRLLGAIEPGAAVDAQRLTVSADVASRPSVSSLQQSAAYLPRDISAHRHYDPVLLREAEDEVFEACGGMEGVHLRLLRT
jgi:hypothetical protein